MHHKHGCEGIQHRDSAVTGLHKMIKKKANPFDQKKSRSDAAGLMLNVFYYFRVLSAKSAALRHSSNPLQLPNSLSMDIK